jgi:formylglycine-generating enzyme required for sulfatase activity
MRNRILILTIALLVFRGLSAQKTPHPEYLMRYYFTAAEGAKQSVIPSKDLLKIKGIDQKQYFPCFPQEGLRFNQFLSQVQTGYDTIYAIEEMVSCGPFLAHRTETTNGEYKAFLADSVWIKEHLGYQPRQLFPDTHVWMPFAATAESAPVPNPYTRLYFQNSTYNNYPVVGVSQLQATAYCEWLSHILNESPQYLGLQAALKKQGLKIKAELPTVAEWLYLYEMSIQVPSRKGVSEGKIRGNYFWKNQRMGGALFTFLQHQELNNAPVSFRGTNTTRGLNIQNELSEALLMPLPSQMPPAKPYPAVSHLLGNVAEWTATPAYGHLFNNRTTILNTNGQLIENAYQQVNVFDFKGYLVEEPALQQHYAIKGGSWSQDFHYLDPMAIMFMQSNHSNNHVGFRPVLHFYPATDSVTSP